MRLGNIREFEKSLHNVVIKGLKRELGDRISSYDVIIENSDYNYTNKTDNEDLVLTGFYGKVAFSRRGFGLISELIFIGYVVTTKKMGTNIFIAFEGEKKFNELKRRIRIDYGLSLDYPWACKSNCVNV